MRVSVGCRRRRVKRPRAGSRSARHAGERATTWFVQKRHHPKGYSIISGDDHLVETIGSLSHVGTDFVEVAGVEVTLC
jgi:hypothetical protein